MTNLSEPLTGPKNFWAYVAGWQNPEICWEWCGAVSHNGYGYCSIYMYGTTRPNRFAYELLVGIIPEGLDLDHLCKNRLCVNPKHLEPVTRRENLCRSNNFIADNIKKTQCPKGHDYDGINSQGRRICKECQRASTRAWKQKSGYKSHSEWRT